MNLKNLYRAFTTLLAAYCLLSIGEVGSPTEGLTRGPLADAAPAPGAMPEAEIEAPRLALSQPQREAPKSPFAKGAVEASFSIATD